MSKSKSKIEVAIGDLEKSGKNHIRVDGKRWIEYNRKRKTIDLLTRKKMNFDKVQFSVLDRERIDEDNMNKHPCFNFLTKKRKPHTCTILKSIDHISFGQTYLLYDGELEKDQKHRIGKVANFQYCEDCDQTIVWSNMEIRSLQRFL